MALAFPYGPGEAVAGFQNLAQTMSSWGTLKTQVCNNDGLTWAEVGESQLRMQTGAVSWLG